MHTLRLSLAGTVVLALLAGSAIGVAGQGDDVATPSTTDSLLSGFVTEEIEPGVVRVVSDGVRGLSGQTGSLVAGLDGSVWLFTNDSFFQFGDEGRSWKRDNRVTRADIEVAPDGTVWGVGLGKKKAGKKFRSDLRSYDGEEWTVRMPAPKKGAVVSVEIQTDGTVWASWVWRKNQASVGRLGERRSARDRDSSDRWSDEGTFHGAEDMWAVGDQLWLEVREPSGDYIYHHDGQDWTGGTIINYLGSKGDTHASGWVDVGPEGTIWVGLVGPSDAATYSTRLARFDGAEWAEWGRVLEGYAAEVAPDGSLWAIPSGVPPTVCDGVVNFDGTTWTEYLQERCVRDIEVGPDGAVWLQAREAGPTGSWEGTGPDETYVIRPDVAAVTD